MKKIAICKKMILIFLLKWIYFIYFEDNDLQIEYLYLNYSCIVSGFIMWSPPAPQWEYLYSGSLVLWAVGNDDSKTETNQTLGIFIYYYELWPLHTLTWAENFRLLICAWHNKYKVSKWLLPFLFKFNLCVKIVCTMH